VVKTEPLTLDAELPLDRWLPDETLFSLASRYHRVSGNRLAATTCLALFGHARQGCAHDLPSRIDAFVERSEGKFGSAVEIIRQRTVLPFFLPFRDSGVALVAETSLRGHSIGHLKFQLGLLTSRFRAHLPLKACRICMTEDHSRFRIAYWHRTHQYPGVWVCPAHGEPLLQSTIKSTGIERFGWHLPSFASLQPDPALTGTLDGSELLPKLGRLSAASVALGNLSSGFHFDADRLATTYREALAAKGLAGKNGRLNMKALGPSYMDAVTGLESLGEMSALPRDASAAVAQVSRLLYRRGTGTHPLRHLLLILWLFGDWTAFWDSYQDSESGLLPPSSAASEELTDGRASPHRDVALELIRTSGCTATKAARTFGVDVSTVMAWLAETGVATARRPKKLKADTKSALVKLVREGADKATVAVAVGVSVTTVTRMLRTEVGLRSAWQSARRKASQVRCRSTWTLLVGSNPNTSLPVLRMVAPDAYAWLYRNDRAWLAECNSERQLSTTAGYQRIDWDARDAVLALAVRRGALEIAETSDRTHIPLMQLCRAVPGLKEKLGQLDRLPLTAQALNTLALRRIARGKSPLL